MIDHVSMTFLPAVLLIVGQHSSGPPWIALIFYLVVTAIILSSAAALWWRLLAQRVRGFAGRRWPTFIATIDDFTVDESVIYGRGRNVTLYEVVLQYVFHNPELQIGEYHREFDDRSEAEAWANSYKGCTVKVHVNPKDPQNSVLRKEDLDDAAFPEPSQKLTTSN